MTFEVDNFNSGLYFSRTAYAMERKRAVQQQQLLIQKLQAQRRLEEARKREVERQWARVRAQEAQHRAQDSPSDSEAYQRSARASSSSSAASSVHDLLLSSLPPVLWRALPDLSPESISVGYGRPRGAEDREQDRAELLAYLREVETFLSLPPSTFLAAPASLPDLRARLRALLPALEVRRILRCGQEGVLPPGLALTERERARIKAQMILRLLPDGSGRAEGAWAELEASASPRAVGQLEFSPLEIRRAFLSLSRLVHPDKHQVQGLLGGEEEEGMRVEKGGESARAGAGVTVQEEEANRAFQLLQWAQEVLQG